MIKDIPNSLLEAARQVLSGGQHPMIDVDGEQKHRHNSLGQPIHHTDEGIKNFHRWFGDDSNIDEHGRPKVLYHSSLKRLDAFDPHGKFMGYTGTSGISLTDSPEMASRYLDRYGTHGYVDGVPNQPFEKNIIPVYAKVGKTIERDEPLKTNIKLGFPLPKDYVPTHKEMGYDTLIRNDAISRRGPVKHSTAKNAIRGKEYVLTSPSQIKSAIGNTGAFSHPTKITESEDYREEHSSPDPETGSPAHDLTKNAYAEDFYSSKGHQYYGDGRDDDKIVHSHLKSLRNRPEAEVKIYRAVPNKDEIKDINPGDWVAITHNYAKDHGELRFGDDHKILTKTVKAKELFTSGDSYHEFGYHPSKQQHYTMSDSVRKAYMNMQND